MSRSRMIDYYNAALDTLAGYEKTREVIGAAGLSDQGTRGKNSRA